MQESYKAERLVKIVEDDLPVLFERVGDGGEPAALEILDAAFVRERGERGIDGHLREEGKAVALGGLLALALAEEEYLLPAVRAGDIAHVLHQADDGDIHLFSHLHGLFHDHGDELLRGGDDDDAVERDGLEHAQRHVARAGGHIDEEIVHVPDNIRPELLDDAADDGPAPDDRISLVFKQQVDGHQLDARAACAGIETRLRADGLVVHAEGLGDGGTGDVGVHDAGFEAAAAHGDGKLACDHGLAHAALAGNDAEHLADAAFRMRRFAQGLRRCAFCAALAAARAIMGAFAHDK